VAADPEDPVPPPGVPSDWAEQERILAEEMAAFPAEDEPDWEALAPVYRVVVISVPWPAAEQSR
jgi:hypothetical protein